MDAVSLEEANLSRGQPKRSMVRRSKILSGALEVFLQAGYEGAGVDQIALAAGVSKPTLYNYYSDKESLFLAAVNARAEQAKRSITVELMTALGQYGPIWENSTRASDLDPYKPLSNAARTLVNMVRSEHHVAFARLLLTETNRFPKPLKSYAATLTVRPGVTTVASALDQFSKKRLLAIPDVQLASRQFVSLAVGDVAPMALIGVSFDDKEIDNIVLSALDVFMSAYSTRRYAARTSGNRGRQFPETVPKKQ